MKIKSVSTNSAQLGYHSTNITMAIAQLDLNSAPTAHSTNAAIGTNTTMLPVPVPRAPSGTLHVIMDDGVHMFYCWTHGLGFNRMHTSTTCANAANGHCKTATTTNMQGGKNTIQAGGYCCCLDCTDAKA